MAGEATIRQARPTRQEGGLYALYSNEASEGFVRDLFGAYYLRILGTAFLSPGHDSSYESTVFAKIDGEIVGMASGYSFEEHQRSSLKPVMKAAGPRMLRMLPLGVLAARFLAFVTKLGDGEYYLAALAVNTDSRGKGVASALLDATERRAVEAGCQRLVLDVDIANHGAQRVYQHRGMTVDAESPAIAFMPDKRVYRISKPL